MKSEAKNWAQLAGEDYEASIYLFKGAKYPHAVYLLCQAIEKLLKAVQCEVSNRTPQKVHNLVNLAKNSGLDFSEKQYDSLQTLLTHYNRVRYRDISQAHYNTQSKVEPIIKQGKAIYLWILTKLENH